MPPKADKIPTIEDWEYGVSDSNAAQDADSSDESLDLTVDPGTDALRLFLHEAGQYELLTAEREQELSEQAQFYISLREEVREELEAAGLGGRKRRKKLYNEEDLNEVDGFGERLEEKIEALSEDGRTQLADSKEAFNLFVKSNLRLVVSIAKNYRNLGLPFLDLIQEGTLGLVRAAEKFDRTRKLKFSTYATWWVRQACARALADKAKVIRQPVHVVERSNKIRRAHKTLSAEAGRELDTRREEVIIAIAEHIGDDVAKVREALGAATAEVSFHKSVGEDGDAEFGDFVAREEVPIEDAVAEEIEKTLVGQAVQDLPADLKQVIELRYGLNGQEPVSLDQIGKTLGFTRHKVVKLEKEALEHLALHPLLTDTGDFYRGTNAGPQAPGRSIGMGESKAAKLRDEAFRGAPSNEVPYALRKQRESAAAIIAGKSVNADISLEDAPEESSEDYAELMQSID